MCGFTKQNSRPRSGGKVTLLKRILTAGLITLMLAGMGCSKNASLYRQAAKHYRRGELEAALNTSVQVLQNKPSYAKAQKLLKKAYPELLAESEERLQQLDAETPEDLWDQKVQVYSQLVEYQELVKELDPLVDPKTGEKHSFEYRDYQDKLNQNKLSAAEYHYQKGLAILALSDAPDSQRRAAKEFQEALNYVPNYRDAAQLFTQARELSTKRVAVAVFEDKSGTRSRYGSLIDLLTDTIIAKLVQDPVVREYWDIVSRDQISALLEEQQYGENQPQEPDSGTGLDRFLGAHEIMTGKIIQVNYVPERISELEFKETKYMVTGKEQYTTDKGKVREREVKGDVTCTWKKYTKTASVRITAAFSLIEVKTGVMQHGDTVTAEFAWSDDWGRVVNGGDERVLAKESLEMIRRPEPFPPPELDMVNLALNKLSDEILAKVREHVQK